MWDWLAFVVNVSTIVCGIPMDLAYGAANIIGYDQSFAIWHQRVQNPLTNSTLVQATGFSTALDVFYMLVLLAPLLRILIMLPVCSYVFKCSGRFFAAMVLAEDPEFLLAYEAVSRTQGMARFPEPATCGGFVDEANTASIEALRFLLSEEDRLMFVNSGGLDQTAKEILSQPLNAQEQKEYEELAQIHTCVCCIWDVPGEDKDKKGACCTCSPSYQEVVVRCLTLSDSACQMWSEVVWHLLCPYAIYTEDPLPFRFLLVFKLQLYGGISTILLYVLDVVGGEFEWWRPWKILSLVIAMKYVLGMRHLRTLRTQFPLESNGIVVTDSFLANKMLPQFCATVGRNFAWGKWANSWKPLDPIASDVENSSSDEESREREGLVQEFLG